MGEGKPELNMTRVFDAQRARLRGLEQGGVRPAVVNPAALQDAELRGESAPGRDLSPRDAHARWSRVPDGSALTDVVPNQRIAFSATIHGGVKLEMTVTFAEKTNGKTALTVRQAYSHETVTRGVPAGWTATPDRLGKEAERLASRS